MKSIILHTEEFTKFKKALNIYAMRNRLSRINRNYIASGIHVVYFNNLSLNEAFVLGQAVGGWK
jgi:hypothetical protein